MMHCPICATTVELEQTVCPSCKTPLGEYRQVYYAPDILFNEALDLISQNRYVDACNKLCTAAYLRRDDEGILKAWAYAAEEAGDIVLAVNVLAELMAISDDNEVEAKFDALSSKLNAKPDKMDGLMCEMLKVQTQTLEKMAEGMRAVIEQYGR